MYRAVKVRIYPTDEQEVYLTQCFGNTRWLWNYLHELPNAKFTTITISKNADGRYYTSILFNQEDEPVVAINEAIGVDLGLKNFAVTSNGSK